MKRLLLLALCWLLVCCSKPTQNKAGVTPQATPHGVLLNWTVPSPVGGSGVIAGYNAYRCTGSSCTPTSKINASLVTGGTSYLDSASGLTTNTTYTYGVTTVDSTGGESILSPLVSVNFILIVAVNPPPTLTTTTQ